MRAVSFAALHRMLHLLAEHPQGLRVRDLDAACLKHGICVTRKGTMPAPTTLYHHRNTLVQLEAVRRIGQSWGVNREHRLVGMLLEVPPTAGISLPESAREVFAALVLENPDCKTQFFNLFMPNVPSYTVAQFRQRGISIVWRRVGAGVLSGSVALRGRKGEPSKLLRTNLEIMSILYGLRYWARDELKLVDEFFREDVGSILYPIMESGRARSPLEVVSDVLSHCQDNGQWTTMSLHDLAVDCCEKRRRPLAALFGAVKWLCENLAGHVVLIPTSRRLATVTARSRQREEFELRGYYVDEQGRYISHLRIHNSVRRRADVLVS
jgi:hypothetical protein